ncbi:MAG: Septum-associated rare lipoprotein A [Olavius algarvensis Gamma 1 endosymbiont]|nr:MAG: Septum-associated rare lipoprotein A [Olavius algarvensis Gamma 1 endosymbiont]
MLSKHLIPTLAAILIAIPPAATSAEFQPGHTEEGLASYYHDGLHGRPTASGEIYDKRASSAAHKSLPLGTRVRVTRLSDGRSIEVRINDRGPFVKGRIIDLSRRSARDLGIIDGGLTKVKVEVLSLPERRK